MAIPLGLSWLEQERTLAGTSTQSISQAVVPAPPVTAVAQGLPRSISISSLGINVPVLDGYYDARTGAWTLTEESAFYGTPTTPSNSESGNTFIYGHNSHAIFGKLERIAPNANAVVTTDTGYEFTYRFTSSENVKPTDVMALEYHGVPRLTLQTCSGFWNETRHMFYFTLDSYRKI